MAPINDDPSLHLTRFDKRLIAIAIAVALASLWVATHYFHRAFPEAAIDFRVSATASRGVALDFLHQRGLAPTGDMHAVQFDYDDDAKTFLERELGLDRAQALLAGRIRLWRWDNRWFKPLTKEEFQVGVTPAGGVASFDHIIPDDAPGASLDGAAARALAENFLTHVMHFDMAQLAFVGEEQSARAHRLDYLFTWKDAAPLVPGATGVVAQAEYRHVVRIQGDQVGAYDEYLNVPDQWLRDYSQLRSKNDTAGVIDTGLMIGLLLAGMLFILAQRIGRRDIYWRPALWIGGVGALLSFLNALNELPGQRFGYDTTQSYGAFLAGALFSALVTAVGVGVLLALLTAAGESLYRERFKRHIALDRWLSRPGVRSKAFLLSMVLGLMLAAFFFAYQTVFYLIANHLGAWAPADTNYDSILNTHFPWIAVLLGGFFPAISEEFGFRMFAIPLFERWAHILSGTPAGRIPRRQARSIALWLAVLGASFLWGFGHATYPNEPFYIRGLEVGFGGILLSWMMIRFGILTTVVWHYTVDALYTAMLLLRAHSAYLRFSGGLTAFLAVVPLLFAIVAYVRKGSFASDRTLTNAALGSAPPPVRAAGAAAEAVPAAAAAAAAYRPVRASTWVTGAIVGAVMLSAFAVRLPRWSSVLPWTTSQRQAVAAAAAFVRQQGFNPGDDRVSVLLATPDSLSGDIGLDNQVAAADLFAARGRVALQQAFSGPPPTVPALYWRVRFFQPLQEVGYSVGVRIDVPPGSAPGTDIEGYVRTLPDAAPGASPSLDQARALAADFLRARGIDISGLSEKIAQQEKRQARTDTDFVWESPHHLLPSGVAWRVEAQLAGDHVSLFHAWYFVPESRLRAFEQSTLRTSLADIAPWLLGAFIALMIVLECYRFARSESASWAPLLRLAGLAAAVGLVFTVGNLPLSIAGYDTTQPWSAFRIILATQVAVACLGAFLLTLVLFAPLTRVAPQAAALWHRTAWRRAAPVWAGDAVGASLMALAWAAGWQRVMAVVSSRWHAAGQPPMPAAPNLASYYPPLTDFCRILFTAVWLAALFGILLPLLSAGWKHPRRRPLVLLAVLLAWATLLPPVHSGAQFALGAILAAVELLLLLLFAHWFLRDNPLAWLTALLLPLLIDRASQWSALGGAVGHRYADVATAIFFLLAGLGLIWLLRLSRHHRDAPV